MTEWGDRDLAAVLGEESVRRMKACWNACNGAPTEWLEQNKPVKELADAIRKIEAQRDELLVVLQKLAQHAGPHITPDTLLLQAYADACAAIARATGSTS